MVLILFLFFAAQNSALAFFDIPSAVMDEIWAKNEDKKVFCKNLKEYGRFLDSQGEFPCEARFVAPVYTSTPRKNLRLIATCLYFNLLKNEELMDLQKEEITEAKQFLDAQRECGNQKGIKEALEAYTQAQVDYLTYKKSFQMCLRQLENLGAKTISLDYKLLSFDVEKAVLINATPNLDETESDLRDHIQYEYLKSKNLEKRVQKCSAAELPNDNTASLQAKYDLVELKKELLFSKLRFVVYYFSLKEALY